MISYAGIPIGVDTPDGDEEAALGLLTLSSWLRSHYDPRAVYDEAWRTWPGWNQGFLPGFRAWPWRPIEPGVLFWPFGASRWAQAYYVVTDAQLAAIRATVYGSAGTSYAVQNLVLFDGTNTVTAPMWLLPARPLAQIVDTTLLPVGGLNLWLLGLVDSRFYWWQSAASVTVTAGTTTWANLFSSIGSALTNPDGAVTITTDTISSNYVKPPGDLAARYDALPPLLDAACACIGHRLVRSYAGVVVTQTATTAKSSVDAQKGLYNRVAGGEFSFTANT